VTELPLPKPQLRAYLRGQRQQIPPAQHRHLSRQVIHHLTRHPCWSAARQVFGYVSIQGEPDVGCLWHEGEKIWGLPRRYGSTLRWHRWQAGTSLTGGTIPEPDPGTPVLTPQPGDVLLIPALAYDRQGYRLGYGGGYFDRLLAQPEWQGVYRVGLIFQAFLLPVLPRDPWDQRVQAVCTDQGWWEISPPETE